MGIFKNKSQATFDNMSPNDTSKGVVGGLIFCNQTNAHWFGSIPIWI